MFCQPSPLIFFLDFGVDRLNSGISPPFSFVKTTSTEWAHQQLVAPPIPNISRVVTESLVFRFVLLCYLSVSHEINTMINCRSMGWISLLQNVPLNSPGNGQLTTTKVHFYLNSLHTAMEGTRKLYFLFSFVVCHGLIMVTTRMSDPGTTYRTREEVQRMRSTQDPIRGLQKNIEEWGVATEQELKALTCILFVIPVAN